MLCSRYRWSLFSLLGVEHRKKSCTRYVSLRSFFLSSVSTTTINPQIDRVCRLRKNVRTAFLVAVCQGFLGSANGTLQASKTVLPILISFPGFCNLAAVRSVRLCVRQHAEPGGIQSWYTCSVNQLSLDSDILGSDRRSSVGAIHETRE